MNYFDEAKRMINEALSNTDLDNAKEYMYIHGFLTEMNKAEREMVRDLISEQRNVLNEQVSEFGYNEHVKTLQTELANAGFSCGQDQAGVFSAGTLNALQTALNTYLQLKQQGGRINENSMDEIAWLSLSKHKDINKVDPQEWGDWATRNPNDAVQILNGWLQNSNGNEDVLYKVSQCIMSIPTDIALYRTTREQLKQLYNNYVKTMFANELNITKGVTRQNTSAAQQPQQAQQQKGYGPGNLQTFDMAGIVRNNFVKTFQNELKQTNDFIIDTLDGTFDQATMTACQQLLYKISQLKR